MEIGNAIKTAQILLVDDFEMILDAWRRLLEHEGFRVTCAKSGREAIRLMQGAERFDIVLLDYELPDISGLEVLDWIRLQKDLAKMPVIMTTASVMNGEECLDYGADYFLPKPIDIDELLSAVINETSNGPL